MIGVFCRNLHYREGWNGHGYVTILVRCADPAELDRVQQHMATKGLTREHFDQWWSEWYGGCMDLVAILPHATEAVVAESTALPAEFALSYPKSAASKGDNRYVAILDADAILRAAPNE